MNFLVSLFIITLQTFHLLVSSFIKHKFLSLFIHISKEVKTILLPALYQMHNMSNKVHKLKLQRYHRSFQPFQ